MFLQTAKLLSLNCLCLANMRNVPYSCVLQLSEGCKAKQKLQTIVRIKYIDLLLSIFRTSLILFCLNTCTSNFIFKECLLKHYKSGEHICKECTSLGGIFLKYSFKRPISRCKQLHIPCDQSHITSLSMQHQIVTKTELIYILNKQAIGRNISGREVGTICENSHSTKTLSSIRSSPRYVWFLPTVLLLDMSTQTKFSVQWFWPVWRISKISFFSIQQSQVLFQKTSPFSKASNPKWASLQKCSLNTQ